MSKNQINGLLALFIFAGIFIVLGLGIGYFLGLFTFDLSNLGYFIGILAIFGSIFSIYIDNKYKHIQALEENLRNERRKIYLELLKPHIIILSNISSKEADPKKKLESQNETTERISKLMNSEAYTQNYFEYLIFGSDEAITANNEFMQYLYKNDKKKADPKAVFKLMAKLFLAARKDVGVKDTKLSEIDMFKWKITDIDNFFGDNK